MVKVIIMMAHLIRILKQNPIRIPLLRKSKSGRVTSEKKALASKIFEISADDAERGEHFTCCICMDDFKSQP